MFKKWYKITGISKEMHEVWKKDMRDDLVTWEDSKGPHFRINLSIIGAFLLRRQMKKWNSDNIGCIRLIKLKECEA